jgi:hypothetical protein
MNQIQVFTADEGKYLMEKVVGLLAESNARKKKHVTLFYCTLLSFLFNSYAYQIWTQPYINQNML